MGKGGMGGCRWEWGVVAANLWLSCLRTGRALYFFPFLRSLWDGEGRGGGMPVGVGSGCRELSVQLLRGRAV